MLHSGTGRCFVAVVPVVLIAVVVFLVEAGLVTASRSFRTATTHTTGLGGSAAFWWGVGLQRLRGVGVAVAGMGMGMGMSMAIAAHIGRWVGSGAPGHPAASRLGGAGEACRCTTVTTHYWPGFGSLAWSELPL